MKEKLLGEWITALKSGIYTQVQWKLQNTEIPNNYCCLGVLSALTSHRDERGVLQYPDCTIINRRAHFCIFSVSHYTHTLDFIHTNDDGPLDNYSRTLWLLETAPELFITE